MSKKKFILASLTSVTLLGAASTAVAADESTPPASGVEETSVAQVRIKVVDEAGQPVPNVAIDTLVNGKAAEYTTTDQGALEITTNGGDAVRYRIAKRPEGYEYVTYNGNPVSNEGELTANAANLQERTLVLKKTNNQDQDTQSTQKEVAQVRIKVVDEAGQPVPNVAIDTLVNGKAAEYTTTDQGVLEITTNGGDAVRYRIAKSPEGYEYVTYNGKLVSNEGALIANSASLQERTLILKKADNQTQESQSPKKEVAQVRIKVVDEAGQPVPNVAIDTLVNGKAAEYTTTDQGVLEITTIGGDAVRYRIAKRPEGYEYVTYEGKPVSNEGALIANSASLQERTLILKKTDNQDTQSPKKEVAQVRIKVVDEAGQPVPNVAIDVLVNGKATEYTTTDQGVLEITTIGGDAVRYRIAKRPEGYEYVTYEGKPVSNEGALIANSASLQERTLILKKKTDSQGQNDNSGQNTNSNQNDNSGQNTNPSQNDNSGQNTNPIQNDNSGQNTNSNQNNNQKPDTNSSATKVTPAAKDNNKKALPNTGDSSSILTVVGTLLSGLGLAGVAKHRPKHFRK
ncbi:LPXTG cell wall anchor domain-containing protein [Streptococcus merionis]|uniref:LPXTG cell wall anchor domain-containing protein n=1 Tax=Streptococcus merionis TaxID=400065 RepID=UPI00351519F7